MQKPLEASAEDNPIGDTSFKVQRASTNSLSYLLMKFDDLMDYTGEDQVGTTIGYVILDSLIDFKFYTTSENELNFREIRTIYAGLQSIINCASKDEDLYMEQMSNTKRRVNDFINDVSTKERKFDSPLLELILNSIYEQNSSYEDTLRRKGLHLMETLDLSIPYKSNRSSNLADYKNLKQIFV